MQTGACSTERQHDVLIPLNPHDELRELHGRRSAAFISAAISSCAPGHSRYSPRALHTRALSPGLHDGCPRVTVDCTLISPNGCNGCNAELALREPPKVALLQAGTRDCPLRRCDGHAIGCPVPVQMWPG